MKIERITDEDNKIKIGFVLIKAVISRISENIMASKVMGIVIFTI